jgi:hypothetical protein
MNSATKTLNISLIFFMVGLLLCASAQGAGVNTEGQDLVPTGKGRGELPDPRRKSKELAEFNRRAKRVRLRTKSNGINYNGGPVMIGPTNVYYIWYGNWSGNTAASILNDFANSIGRSPYFNINATYYDGSNQFVSNDVFNNGSTVIDTKIYSESLLDANIKAIVSGSCNRPKSECLV